MDSGFTQAKSTNLSQVDVDIVTQFFVDNAQYFSAEMRNIKTQKSTKEAYGANAICYVQVKREGGICIVRAKITPEHKIRKKPYRVEVNVDENTEKVINCSFPLSEITFSFTTLERIGSRFLIKDVIPDDLMSNIIYKFKDSSCLAT